MYFWKRGSSMRKLFAITVFLVSLPLMTSADVSIDEDTEIIEYKLDWAQIAPDVVSGGSTHELTWDRNGGGRSVWVTGPDYDGLAKIKAGGVIEYYAMPKGSEPHGIMFDDNRQLWVSLEGSGFVVQVDQKGRIRQDVEVSMRAEGVDDDLDSDSDSDSDFNGHRKRRAKPINPDPHGITPGPEPGEIWFTGRRTNTVGRFDRWGSVTHYEIDTSPARLIYLKQGPREDIWGTELLGNKILRVDRNGKVKEYEIPTEDSRPIAITPGPNGNMWFSEEAGRKVARIDRRGNITEFPVPLPEGGDRLLVAGLAFDDRGYLWTHAYRGRTGSEPDGDDFIVRFGREIVNIDPEDLPDIDVTLYPVPSRGTIMHRITQGPDGRIWFTELGTDKVGVLTAD